MKSLYVGCALRGAPAEFVAGVGELKKQLENDFKVLHFIGISPTAAAKEVYETDIGCTIEADIMLAICDQSSLGLGIEIAKRAELGKATIIAYRPSVDLSRMVLGLAELSPSFTVVTYNDPAELLAIMKKYA